MNKAVLRYLIPILLSLVLPKSALATTEEAEVVPLPPAAAMRVESISQSSGLEELEHQLREARGVGEGDRPSPLLGGSSGMSATELWRTPEQGDASHPVGLEELSEELAPSSKGPEVILKAAFSLEQARQWQALQALAEEIEGRWLLVNKTTDLKVDDLVAAVVNGKTIFPYRVLEVYPGGGVRLKRLFEESARTEMVTPLLLEQMGWRLYRPPAAGPSTEAVQGTGLEEQVQLKDRKWAWMFDPKSETFKTIRRYDQQRNGAIGDKIDALHRKIEQLHEKEKGPRSTLVLGFGLPEIIEASPDPQSFEANLNILEELVFRLNRERKIDWVMVTGFQFGQLVKQAISGDLPSPEAPEEVQLPRSGTQRHFQLPANKRRVSHHPPETGLEERRPTNKEDTLGAGRETVSAPGGGLTDLEEAFGGLRRLLDEEADADALADHLLPLLRESHRIQEASGWRISFLQRLREALADLHAGGDGGLKALDQLKEGLVLATNKAVEGLQEQYRGIAIRRFEPVLDGPPRSFVVIGTYTTGHPSFVTEAGMRGLWRVCRDRWDRPLRIAEVGAGHGVVSAWLAGMFPNVEKVFAIDQNFRSKWVVEVNTLLNFSPEVLAKIEFIEADVAPEDPPPVDVVYANPNQRPGPPLSIEQSEQDAAVAYASDVSGGDGLTMIRRILKQWGPAVREGGILLPALTDWHDGARAQKIFADAGWIGEPLQESRTTGLYGKKLERRFTQQDLERFIDAERRGIPFQFYDAASPDRALNAKEMADHLRAGGSALVSATAHRLHREEKAQAEKGTFPEASLFSGLEEAGLDRFGEGRRRFPLELYARLNAVATALRRLDGPLAARAFEKAPLLEGQIFQKPDREFMLAFLEWIFKRSHPHYLLEKVSGPWGEEQGFQELSEALQKMKWKLGLLQMAAEGRFLLSDRHPRRNVRYLYGPTGSPVQREWVSPSEIEHLDQCPYCLARWVQIEMSKRIEWVEGWLSEYSEFVESTLTDLRVFTKEQLLDSLRNHVSLWENHLERSRDHPKHLASIFPRVFGPMNSKESPSSIERFHATRAEFERFIREAPIAQIRDWIGEALHVENQKLQKSLDSLCPLVYEVFQSLPGFLEKLEPLVAQREEAFERVEDIVQEIGMDNAWHVVSAEAVKKYPGLRALALQVPQILLDDESHSQAILTLMEQTQSIEKVHYHGTESEIYGFYARMMRKPSPIQELTWKWDWFVPRLLTDAPFTVFLENLFRSPTTGAQAAPIDYNQLTRALELLAGA